MDPDRHDKVFARLVKYGMAKEKTEGIMKKIALASHWADDNASDEKFEMQLSDLQRKVVTELLGVLPGFAGVEETPENAKALQSKVFDVARANGMEPRDLFAMLYRMFLNTEKGPRIGNYFLDLGVERVSAVLKRYL
jgi:lysyl-tRNA synthetase class 1